MTEESGSTTNGADSATSKPTTGKARAAKKAGSRKKTAKKKTKASAKKRTGATKTAKKSAKRTPQPKGNLASKEKGKPGRSPDKAMRLLLLEQKHPDWKTTDFVREVPCVTNFVYNVRKKKRAYYEQQLSALGEEDRAKLLAGPILNTKGGKKNRATHSRTPQQGDGEAVFRRALRLVSIERARQLLDQYEKLLDQFENG
jgi:hypothetical protein